MPAYAAMELRVISMRYPSNIRRVGISGRNIMQTIETGLFLGRLPYAKVGTDPDPILVINGGQGFMMKPDRARLIKDARRIGRILPEGCSFVIIGYDPNPPEVTVEAIADDVGYVIDRHFAGQAVVLGISYGAVVATHLAARYPDRIRKLVLIAGAHDFSAEGRKRLATQIDLARRGELARLVLEFASVFRRPWLNLLLRLRIRLRGRSIVSALARREVIIQYLDAMLRNDIQMAALNKLFAKALVIGGSRDQFFGETIRLTSQAIPNAKLEIFEEETHMVPIERAKEVKTLLAEFLAY
jgi:pimeloyl-ACP methyl ester carboxylesterase